MSPYIKIACALCMIIGGAVRGGEVAFAYGCYGIYVLFDGLSEFAREKGRG